ncbi:hypothetical protein CORC01_09758 [Colletotrichum orchidophilum]|uniref:Fungal N-terminal domain-containing protein n=1 Tax=Colletotrichum orchidophilum TaxID=1209926 RepID=A0A1G4B0Q0_9PEZI|nr:uncharacterized protein CORC01_09758 [Colletotrichum orchidophilum]OHE94964.1 hypothetical protein CORC01_09758 [Colletotrichum orchidophilum]
MADPLSIAGSVGGLLAIAVKVCNTTASFVSSTIDAPESAMQMFQLVDEMRMTLFSVDKKIGSLSTLPSSRKNMIQLDHLSIVITHSVLTLSKLESIICQQDGLRSRIRWALWHEKKVISLLPRLESQKSTLALMMTVLNRQRFIKNEPARVYTNYYLRSYHFRVGHLSETKFHGRIDAYDAVETEL